ncbi:hypothetical protein BS78_02G023100 [Paspalum vaginatum]|nr:hypothetical protein BS78_02G023100 [Paspalum vaginatum]
MPVTNLSHKPFVVGIAEGVDAIFVSTAAGLFTVNLNSAGQAKKIDEPGVYFSILPYMSFYTPGMTVADWCRGISDVCPAAVMTLLNGCFSRATPIKMLCFSSSSLMFKPDERKS